MEKEELYNSYIEYCEELDIPQSSRLSKEIFDGKENPTEDQIMLGFVSPKAGATISFGMGSVLNDVIKDPVNFANNAAGTIKATKEYVGKLKQAGDTIVNTGKNIFRPGAPGGSSTGGTSGGGGSSNNGGGTSNFNFSTMNLNPTPLSVVLDTGIVPNTYGKYFLNSNDSTSCLHVTNAKLAIPTSGDDHFFNWWDTVVAFNLQTTMQRRLSFNMNLTAVSSIKLRTYFNTLLDALQYWYFTGGVLSYANNPHNHNEGMLKLRSYMTADNLDDLYRLQRVLAGFPIPPNMNNLCQFLCSNFKESLNPGAGILKVMPVTWGTSATNYFQSYDGNIVSSIIDALETDDNRYIASIMAKAFPSWLKVNITVPSDTPLYSPNFNTYFANLPYVASTNSGPRPSTEKDLVFYGSYADRLDGAVFGLLSMYQTDVGKWTPSLVTPITSTFNSTVIGNRFSFYSDGTNTGFFAASEFTKLAYSRGESYTLVGALPHAFRKFGMEEMLQVTPATVRETAYKLIEWLIKYDDSDLGSINSDEALSAKPKRRRRKRSK